MVMTPEEARKFWALSPDVRLAIARKAGFLINDYEESLRICEAHERAVARERFIEELGPNFFDNVA